MQRMRKKGFFVRLDVKKSAKTCSERRKQARGNVPPRRRSDSARSRIFMPREKFFERSSEKKIQRHEKRRIRNFSLQKNPSKNSFPRKIHAEATSSASENQEGAAPFRILEPQGTSLRRASGNRRRRSPPTGFSRGFSLFPRAGDNVFKKNASALTRKGDPSTCGKDGTCIPRRTRNDEAVPQNRSGGETRRAAPEGCSLRVRDKPDE